MQSPMPTRVRGTLLSVNPSSQETRRESKRASSQGGDSKGPGLRLVVLDETDEAPRCRMSLKGLGET